MKIQNVADLEDRLSCPGDADVFAMAAMKGDLLILGVGGKMGPSLARLACRAADMAGTRQRIVAVARFSDPDLPAELSALGIETIPCDLLEPGALKRLPEIPNIIFMAARKFGSSGAEHLTWAMNTYLPALVAERYRHSRIVAFSTGNVYPLRSVSQRRSHGVHAGRSYRRICAVRARPRAHVRIRLSDDGELRVTILRLNYAVELRYGVLVDIGRAVFERRPISLSMPFVNVIWQRDANSWCLRSFAHCQSPPFVLNITGPETLSVRDFAMEFGQALWNRAYLPQRWRRFHCPVERCEAGLSRCLVLRL